MTYPNNNPPNIDKFAHINTDNLIPPWEQTKKSVIDKKQIKNYDLNFIKNNKFYSWHKLKAYNIKMLEDEEELFILSHNNDKIIGKPIPLFISKKKINLLLKIIEKKDGEDVAKFRFIDDRFDRRYGGYISDKLSLDFWIYKLIYNNKEYILFSKEELRSQEYEISGMNVEIDDLSEVGKYLKFKSISSIFFVENAKSSILTLSKKELIEYTKENNITKDKFMEILFTKDDGNVYLHPTQFNEITVCSLLSGKFEGYPLSLMIMGPVGTGKTFFMECIYAKFKESEGIFEAANSTIKGLIPSFKEIPPNPGYILRCNRIAFIDELMKMIEHAKQSSKRYVLLMFGQLNMLLEHKERTIGSGNNNLKTQSTSKILIATNPLIGKNNLREHLKEIDQTTLSRMLIWVQDIEHVKFVRKKNYYQNPEIKHLINSKYDKREKCIEYYLGVLLKKFLTIYDSCNAFIIEFDYDRIKEIFNRLISNLEGQLKEMYDARGLHHLVLLLDGLVKMRCLFVDYDDSFKANDDDYIKLEEMGLAIIRSWETIFDFDENIK